MTLELAATFIKNNDPKFNETLEKTDVMYIVLFHHFVKYFEMNGEDKSEQLIIFAKMCGWGIISDIKTDDSLNHG